MNDRLLTVSSILTPNIVSWTVFNTQGKERRPNIFILIWFFALMRLYYKTLSILVCSVLFLICLYSLVIELQRNYSDVSLFPKEQFSIHRNEEYNVWCIFTKIRTHKVIKERFSRMLFSLLNTTSSMITLNLITDSSSRIVAKEIILNLKNSTGKDLKVCGIF